MPAPSVDQSMLCGGRLTIDLQALADNWRTLNRRCGAAECAAAVKGDGYGIGLEQAVSALHGTGCRTFFVALPTEGIIARAVAPDARVFVLGGLLQGAAEIYRAGGLIPVLNTPSEALEWAKYCCDRGERLPAALHVDTGMNRLGMTHAQAAQVAGEEAILQSMDLVLVMSHLVCAGDSGHPLNALQLERFLAVADLFPGVARSLANSAGIGLGADYHLDMVRPGISLYGAAAADDRSDALSVVVTAQARVLMVREASKGEIVGYGATQTLTRDCRLAILGAGYADGYNRLAGTGGSGGQASVCIAGYRLPIVGRISMDLITVDASDVPPELCRRGDWVELFGPRIPIDEVAGHAETIGYEMLTGLGRRYARIYVGGAEKPVAAD